MKFYTVLFIMIFTMVFFALSIYLIRNGLNAKYIAFPMVGLFFIWLFFCIIKYEIIKRWKK